eukprot:GHVT01093998.1.p1 GENE.GHVT01093998.1~~GHVT01093998.1.p1  ORF type:complete len:221 (+),score=33.71 GHVT01093998.1:309-971(+)
MLTRERAGPGLRAWLACVFVAASLGMASYAAAADGNKFDSDLGDMVDDVGSKIDEGHSRSKIGGSGDFASSLGIPTTAKDVKDRALSHVDKVISAKADRAIDSSGGQTLMKIVKKSDESHKLIPLHRREFYGEMHPTAKTPNKKSLDVQDIFVSRPGRKANWTIKVDGKERLFVDGKQAIWTVVAFAAALGITISIIKKIVKTIAVKTAKVAVTGGVVRL